MKLIELLNVTKGMETFILKDKTDTYLLRLYGSELRKEKYRFYHDKEIKIIVSLESLTVLLDIYYWQVEQEVL